MCIHRGKKKLFFLKVSDFRFLNTIYCAPFEKMELAFRNQLAQTNGVLFRRPRGTSENRIALANRTIDGDLFRVRRLYSRGIEN